MTSSGYTLVMKKIGIAELKAKLSENLREVRRVETITVLDRSGCRSVTHGSCRRLLMRQLI